MSARRIVRSVGCVVAICVALTSAASAESPAYQVIVHPDNPIDAIDAGFLRNAYLKKVGAWRSGVTIRPIDLPSRIGARADFVVDILKKTLPQLRNYWNQRVFSGKGVPPPQVDSVAAAIAYVLNHPGAVAYLPANASPGRAKVIEVR